MRLPALVLLMCSMILAPTHAAEFPERPVRIIVPYQPGGLIDVTARLIGQKLREKWKQPIIVENRAGASGTIGIRAAAQSEPDGYTLLMTSNSEFTINPALLREVPYDLDRDFNAITTISDSPLAIVTRARAPFNTPQEMLAYTKAQGQPLQYASVGTGSLNHLVSEWMASSLGLNVQHIPYKGGAPAIAALLSEEIQYGVLSLAVTKPQLKPDGLKIVAITSAERSAIVPDVPTLKELGVPVLATIWVGLFTPKKVPSAINRKIHDDVVEILNMPETRAALKVQSSEARPASPEAFLSVIRSEAAQYRTIIKQAKIAAE